MIIFVAVYILFTIYRLKHEVSVEQQISDIKLRFFTNISHELRTPLTLIAGPVEQVLKNDKLPADAREQLVVVEWNTNPVSYTHLAKGGIPVLFNSIVRRNFVQQEDASIATDARRAPGEQELPKEGNVLYDTHGAYLDSPRNVAKEMGVAFIDMNKITHDLVQGLGPAESKKLFMFVEPEKVPAFPKGREDNTHLNVYGARTIAGLTVDAIAKEIPELAKYVRHYDYVVAQDGTGDFFTVQEAINAVPEDVYKRQ